MSVLYEIRVMDKVTAGWGTIMVKTPEKTVFFEPENRAKAVDILKAEGDGEDG